MELISQVPIAVLGVFVSQVSLAIVYAYTFPVELNRYITPFISSAVMPQVCDVFGLWAKYTHSPVVRLYLLLSEGPLGHPPRR
jgi:hypothetical protein